MANRGLRGRVVDEQGQPLAGLVVDARDVDVFLDDDLGEARTDADGRYALAYAPSAYQGLVDARPDLAVRVLDRAGLRTLAETGTFRQTREDVLDLPDVVVARREAEGVFATGGTAQALRVSRGNLAEVLIDGEAAFQAILDAVRDAARSLRLTQLLFDAEFAAAYDDRGGARPHRLVDALKEACARGVDVSVMLNQNAVVPDDVDEIAGAFRGACRPDHPVLVRRFPMSPATMHAKMLVADDEEAIVIGQPFQQRFWDTRAHPFEDGRRGDDMPHHDVSLRLRGPAVADVARVFADLWNRHSEAAVPGAHRILPPTPSPPAGGTTAQVVLTTPEGVLAPQGEQTVLEAYLRALASAEELVYLETQYFTSERLTDALERALATKPGLEVVVLLNESMDIPLYNQWQRKRLAQLGWPRHERLCVCSPWQVGERDGVRSARTVYVHSKAAVVDDAWATVGSANLDGISLDGAAEFGLRRARSIDMNVVLVDGLDGGPSAGLARGLRVALWKEMLGLPEDRLRERPRDGWARLWQEAAERNLAALHERRRMERGLVLPHQATLPEGIKVLERGMKPFMM